jgi:hypothetical protein
MECIAKWNGRHAVEPADIGLSLKKNVGIPYSNVEGAISQIRRIRTKLRITSDP